MEDGTGHAEKMLGLDGVRVLDVEERPGGLVVKAGTTRTHVVALERCLQPCFVRHRFRLPGLRSQSVDARPSRRQIRSAALEWVTELGQDLQDADYPPEASSLGRTLIRWRKEIAAWHAARVTTGPTEAVNDLNKRVKHAAFGFMSFCNYRIRSLTYAGKPDWDLLAP